MKNIFKLMLLWLLDILGINALCRMLNREKALILWYHGICDDDFNLTKRHLPKSELHKQLSYLKRKGYVFVSMTELLAIIKNRRKIDRSVALTFDDGFRNVVENAYPVMQEFGAKGCFYLVSDLIGTNQLLWTDYVETVIRNQKKGNFEFIFKGEKVYYRLGDKKSYEYAMKDIKAKLRAISDEERIKHLEQFSNFKLDNIPKEFLMASWEQVRELDPDVLEIGSHTRKHPNCANITSNKELEDEIYHSKIEIEKNIGYTVEHFCYPAGSHNDRVIAKVKEYGYRSAVTVEHGFNDQSSDLYKLMRIGASEEFLLFKARVSGSCDIARRIKAMFHCRSRGGSNLGFQPPTKPVLTES
jgi:peptidoglycan/xylan/chitin deacetylase (PgdA/CDA1 family)